MVIGLNPSTADEVTDDPTVRRCINYAKAWGYAGLCMTNLFAYRATDPVVMKAVAEPIGPDNDRYLAECANVLQWLWRPGAITAPIGDAPARSSAFLASSTSCG